MCIADFYLEDSVFIAYSHDKMTPDDLILDEQGRKAFFFSTITVFQRFVGLILS